MKVQSNHSPTFNAGFTKAMKQEIASCDVARISNHIEKLGIPNDFNGNKTIAWCCLKVLEMIKPLKKGLPNGIFVEDFNKLDISIEANALVNLVPSKIIKGVNVVIPEKVMFFNQDSESSVLKGKSYWENLDEEADVRYLISESPTDFFLDVFIHEFSHVLHNEHLVKKYGMLNLSKRFGKQVSEEGATKFNDTYGKLMEERVCKYASCNFLEAVACDMTKRFVANMDKDKLQLRRNIFLEFPYRNLSFFEGLFGNDRILYFDKIINCFWNGKT